MKSRIKLFKRLQAGPLAPLWRRFAPSITLVKRFQGCRLYYDFRDNYYLFILPSKVVQAREWPLLELWKYVEGSIWDIGANIGYLTVAASRAGRKAVAFEMSTRAVELMEKTRNFNQLDFEIVSQAFAAEEKSYTAPSTSNPGNQMVQSEEGESKSITYKEAEFLFGTPSLIKMDIEGMEKDLFACDDFKHWIVNKGIVFVVEVHRSLLGFTPIWEDVPHVILPSEIHYLYCGDVAKLKRMLNELNLVLDIQGLNG